MQNSIALINPFSSLAGVSEKMAAPDPIEQREYLCHGELKTWHGPVGEVFSPIYMFDENQRLKPYRLGSFPEMDEKAMENVLDSAHKAYDLGRGPWPVMKVEERINHIETFLKRMQMLRNHTIQWLMWEIGKSYIDSAAEFDRTTEYITDTIETLKTMDQEWGQTKLHQDILAHVKRGPLGVVLCMGPYNYPLNETFATLIPAVIMGNTVIFRPARFGFLLMRPFLDLFRDCFPKGVINVIYGDGEKTAGTLMKSGRIDVLAFIGSSRVANILKKQHPRPNRLRSVLGLDAKNPAIILADADMDVTVNECVTGALAFNGQRCTALKMIFVHSSRKEEFLQQFCKRISKLKMGLPWDDSVDITPLPEPGKPDYLQQLVDDAILKGASVCNEGGGRSYMSFYTPTVLFPVKPEMRIFEEEQFGPLIPIVEFEHVDEAIHYMVQSQYGQQVSIFGTNPESIASLIDPLVNQVCRVNINTKCQRGPDVFPFNGRKDSAEGTLSVHDALRVFSIKTMVATRDTLANKTLFTAMIEHGRSNFLNRDSVS
jgi:glyceraldehyde-3-phosphate dehydrogenase (NADP+)